MNMPLGLYRNRTHMKLHLQKDTQAGSVTVFVGKLVSGVRTVDAVTRSNGKAVSIESNNLDTILGVCAAVTLPMNTCISDHQQSLRHERHKGERKLCIC